MKTTAQSITRKGKLVRSQPPYPVDVSATRGIFIIDAEGNRYCDLTMGWCVGNRGWGQSDLRTAVRTFRGPDYVYPNYRYKPWDELASLLASIAPAGLDHCYRATGGSEAVDTALQLAMAYTGRKKFIAAEGAYHGNSISTLSIGDEETARKLNNRLTGCSHIPLPLNDRAVALLETKLKKRDVAALILEPVLCNVGVHIPSLQFIREARRLCSRYGTLLIFDEVATGFGRTGTMFASEHFGVAPDVMCLAKAITGGCAPLGATLTTARIARKTADVVSIYSTYGWHPLSVHVAIRNIRDMVANQSAWQGHVEKVSQLFRTRLSGMSFRSGHKLSMIGLAIGVHLGDSGYAETIFKKCMKNRLLITQQDDKLVFFPSLHITAREAREALDILEKCI